MGYRRKAVEKENPVHLGGHLHATGRSLFIGEGAVPEDRAYVKVLTSPFARARILSIDSEGAASLPGVLAVLIHRDIPGENQIGHSVLDEPLLAATEVAYAGQPVALAVGRTPRIAEQAAAGIRVVYEELKPILSVEAALAIGSLYVPERRIEKGNVEKGFARSDHVLEGKVQTGAQEHFYLETQRCLAIPGEDGGMTLHSATQSTSEVQEVAARVLGVSSKEITVDVPRLGGGFGGKERTATLWACLAALACYRTGKAVELRLSRQEDMRWTGKRHPFAARYRLGFSRKGKILAYEVELNSNGGAYTDLSVAIMERAMLHAENAYFIPNVRIVGRACRTNLPPNTAMRGFGAPQAIFVIERALERMSRFLRMDPVRARMINAYRAGQSAPYGQAVREPGAADCLRRLTKNAAYIRLRSETDRFNRDHPQVKRGLGLVPVKFGISFTTSFMNQGSALIWIYADGSISLSHGGVEMGQEVGTKVAQVVARELGVKLNRIRIESANTKRVGNASPTAASTGSDINGYAALDAARQLKRRLLPVAACLLREKTGTKHDPKNLETGDDVFFDRRKPAMCVGFADVVHRAYRERVDLGAHGYFRTPGVHFDRARGRGHPFSYFVSGCGLVQAEVDLLSGASRLILVYIVHETSRSLNQEIDRGQIAGAFFQGFGWCTMEEETTDEKGRYRAAGPSTYKIPTIRDLPETFMIDLVERNRRQASVFGSKAIGEPPLIYGEAAYFAVKDAVESIAGHCRESDLAMPATPEAVVLAVEKLGTEDGGIGFADEK